MSDLANDIATVGELAKIVGSSAEAEALLDEISVPHVRGVFSREAFLSALRGGAPRASMSPIPARDVTTRGVDLLRRALGEYAIDVVNVAAGKTLTVTVAARDEARQIVSSDVPRRVERDHLEPGATPLEARVYIAARAPAGTPQYSCSGFLRPHAPSFYFFVMLEPAHVWLLTQRDLRGLWKQLKARRDPDCKFSIGLDSRRQATVRISMPRGWATGLDLSERIAGADGLLLNAGAPAGHE